IRIRASRLGVSSISYVGGKITLKDVDVPQKLAEKIRSVRGLVYPKSRKLVYPFKESMDKLLDTSLDLLAQIGGDDESEE
ncbi:MAG: hypothetical protein IJ125_02435, partial [Atopobiaceae bacterium]|nr:hypothetical protein [Atopobiaceae bacterium]